MDISIFLAPLGLLFKENPVIIQPVVVKLIFNTPTIVEVP